jgi:hypothetical protein
MSTRRVSQVLVAAVIALSTVIAVRVSAADDRHERGWRSADRDAHHRRRDRHGFHDDGTLVRRGGGHAGGTTGPYWGTMRPYWGNMAPNQLGTKAPNAVMRGTGRRNCD